VPTDEVTSGLIQRDFAAMGKSRIKRLRGLARPQYRLRVDELRVFYDVEGNEVQVLSIVPKSEVQSWIERYGELL